MSFGQQHAGTESEFGAGTAPELSERVWWWAAVTILLVATFLRLYALELKPLHHDEGVNGFFLTGLIRSGIYHYDPTNYHGPTLYYFSVPTALLLGLNTFAIRLVPALFGIATIGLTLCLRRHIGSFGALAAAALIAVSPGAVFYSRYFIHESLFVFFTLGLAVAALRYYEIAQPSYLLLASASAALLFATKETAFISAGVLVLATLVAWGHARLMGRRGWAASEKIDQSARSKKKNLSHRTGSRSAGDGLARFGGRSRVGLWLLGAIALFLFINVLFYSSFFTYAEGVNGAIETFKVWTRTGTKDHTKPFHTYLMWLWQEEAPLLVLGAFGATLALFQRSKNRFAVFAGAWAFGLLAAYSLVPYKTPWLALNFIIPLAIIGGYALEVIYQSGESSVERRGVALVLASAAIAICAYQAAALNFSHYDDDRYPYVYAHTRREFVQLVGEIERLAERAGTGTETAMAIASPDYWPLPWYLRDYKRVGFQGRIGTFSESIVVGSEAQVPQLQTTLGANYRRIGNLYALRPGVNLVLYVRRDLVGP